MTITELANKFDALNKTVMEFIAAQSEYNKDTCRHETDLRGNGKDGVLTTLVKIDGRLVHVEDNEKRRQKMVDGLIAALAIMAAIEIIRLIAANL